MIIFSSEDANHSDCVRVIRSSFLGAGWTLCVQGQFPIFLIPPPFVTSSDVGMVLACNPVKASASSVHPMASCDSLYVSHCWTGGLSYSCSLYLFSHNPSLGGTRIVPRFFRGEHHGVIPSNNEIRDGQCVDSFPIQPSGQFCGNQACTTGTVDDLFCPIL